MSGSPVDLNTMPALAPPPGQTSNLQNPENLNHFMYLTAAVGLSLSTAGVILRVFTKARVLRFMQAEEYILMLSLCGFYVFTGLMIQAVLLGQGTHQWNVSVAHVQKILEFSNIIEIVYCPVILGAKVAMLLQMRRLFVVSKKGKLFWLHEILLWTNVPCYLAVMLSFIFACVPREKLWEPTLPGRCISSTGSLIASSSLNVVSDVTMLLLPLTVIARLQLPTRSKIILAAVFGTGILACVSSTFRLYYGIRLTQTQDFSWGIAPIGMWACAEVTTVILAGSFPMLPGFVKFVRGQDGSSGATPGTHNNTNSNTNTNTNGNTHSKSRSRSHGHAHGAGSGGRSAWRLSRSIGKGKGGGIGSGGNQHSSFSYGGGVDEEDVEYLVGHHRHGGKGGDVSVSQVSVVATSMGSGGHGAGGIMMEEMSALGSSGAGPGAGPGAGILKTVRVETSATTVNR